MRWLAAAFLLFLQDLEHADDCCREQIHTTVLRICQSCAKETASCKLCGDCAKAREACEHCLREKGFAPMSNGEDLSGWVVVGNPSWSVENGIIVCKGGDDGWLRTEKEYEDFVWRVEYRVIAEGGNSGLFVRATEQGNPAFTGMEIQILADAGKPTDVHSSSALYGTMAPAKNLAKKAGEWNSVEITCRKRALSVIFNGEKVIDVPNLDDPTLPYQQKKLIERAKKGFIGLQNHEDRVEFRNPRLKLLD